MCRPRPSASYVFSFGHERQAMISWSWRQMRARDVGEIGLISGTDVNDDVRAVPCQCQVRPTAAAQPHSPNLLCGVNPNRPQMQPCLHFRITAPTRLRWKLITFVAFAAVPDGRSRLANGADRCCL